MVKTTTEPDEAPAGVTTLPVVAVRTHAPQGGYLAKKCFEYAAKENMPATYDPAEKLPYSEFAKSLMASGNEFEDRIGNLLTELNPDGDVVVLVEEGRTATGDRTEEGKRLKEEQTWAAYLDPSIRFVFNARFGRRFEELVSEYFGEQVIDSDRVSEPDAIEFGDLMPNGLRAMRFIDVKWHKTTSGTSVEPKQFPTSSLSAPFFPGERHDLEDFYGALNSDDWMQLAHYYRHGESLRLVDGDSSLWGAVIGKEEKLVWSRLDRATFRRLDPDTGKQRAQTPLEMYDRGFAFGLDVVDNALARDVDPSIAPVTAPENKADCKECPWKKICLQELTAYGDGGHITLLPGITPARAQAFYAAGINEIGELARHNPDTPIAGVKDPSVAVYQARVFKIGKVHRAPGVKFLDLPRAAIEIDFDYEADTGAGGVYQRGVRTLTTSKRTGSTGRSVKMRTFDDFSETEAGELRVFTQMWAYFQDAIAKAHRNRKSIRFFHYTQFERVQDMRLAEKYAGQPGVPTAAQVEDFYASEFVVDLYPILSRDLVWPVRSHSIKDLARWVRFSWRDETPGGDASMVWYRNAVSHPDPAVRAENVARLRAYNADDTAAQTALRDFFSNLGAARKPGEKLPNVLDTKAPRRAHRTPQVA